MTRAPIRVSLCLTVAALAATGCGKDTPTNPTPTPQAASFANIQSTIFTPSCESCHTDVGRSPAGMLNLRPGSAFSNLVSQNSSAKAGAVRVIPNNAAGSYLVQKIEGAADIVGRRMPLNGPPFLSDAQVALIRQWITEGARNN